MTGHEETNVRLPPCAIDALAVVAARRGISRDEAVRQVLDEHVELQEHWKPEDRLTHISTVLRYPAPPRWRGDPRVDRPLRLRLAPGGIARARAVSLQLPGQSPRAFRDYQSRLLTDAVMTAIATQEPFTDEFLEGLLPLLRHRAATGLWKLAVVALVTAPEKELLTALEDARSGLANEERGLLRVAEALEEEVAWHSPARFQVATNLAREMLRGAASTVNEHEQMLYEQGEEWDEMRLDMLYADEERRSYLRKGTTGYDWTGRGGAVVWRAERRVEMQDFEDWLVKPPAGPTERRVHPPGWLVRIPDDWCTHFLPAATTRMPAPYATWVAAGQVLAIPVGDGTALWPLIRSKSDPGWAPVLRMEPVLAAARGLRPDQVIGFVEAVLVDWSAEAPDDAPCPLALRLPSAKAYDLGFIDADERRHAMVQARAATLRHMTDIIAAVSEEDSEQRAVLEQVKGDARMFGRMVDRLGVKFSVTKATWEWPGQSVVDEIHTDTPAEAVQWLAGWAHKTCTRLLQQSMRQAWEAAFDRHRAEVPKHRYHAGRRAPHPNVTPTITARPYLSDEMDADSFQGLRESEHDQDLRQHD
ncbi:hypothetical protein [Streptomyces sp. NBC_01187]|uniref:hypothetical protein n=1 Tax=Streptomyces sp. NBC_01187 TaxID=2903766 RepID=UPI00386B838F|nr:hypothetical protein OG220_19295 [Streptomyces sp. NBC_01187]